MEESKGERINKYLAAAGVCSRREADKLVDEGVVTVDGVTALAGTKVFPGQKVAVNGKVIEGKEEQIIIAFNKPAGIVCTTKDAHAEQNIVDYIGFDKRIFPVGRLDKESEGLILLTNDGELSDKILRSRNEHEKEYEVTVNRPVTESF
ncbi:MAG: 23S rRNA pseudouridine synthase F, partial [Lachnospiraceae bacterium]|nr:23S rRNA pseudouridine synthase F [Lachnospiraceae bacterium]